MAKFGFDACHLILYLFAFFEGVPQLSVFEVYILEELLVLLLESLNSSIKLLAATTTFSSKSFMH
jgi:hypothetical protein